MRQIIGTGAMLLVLLSSVAQAQLRVVSSSPSSVQVQAGGSTIPLTLDGYQLTSVTSVRFLVSGSLVGGISGTLKAAQMLPGGVSRLTMDIRADRSVPAGKYQMQLLAGSQGATLASPSIAVLAPLPQPLEPTTTLPIQQPKAGSTTQVVPGVTSATPTAVQLRSGGTPQVVVLSGSLLNQVVGAHVRQGGNRVYTGVVRTEVVPSADPARREIRVSAHGTTGPWDVPLELVLEYTIGSSGATAADAISTPVRITASRPPAVDLSIISCTGQVHAGIVTTTATIKNNGSGDWSFQTGQLVARATAQFPLAPTTVTVTQTMNGQPVGMQVPVPNTTTTKEFAAPGGGLYIAPGGTKEYSASFSYGSAQNTYAVIWTVDPKDVVAEANAANNDRTCSYAPPPPPPPLDLTIFVAAQPAYGPPQTPFVFTVTVTGTRPEAYPPSSAIPVRCTIDNAPFAGSSFSVARTTIDRAILTRSTSFTEPREIRTPGGFAVGTHVLECMVDPDTGLIVPAHLPVPDAGKPLEQNRNNNAKSLVFTVTK